MHAARTGQRQSRLTRQQRQRATAGIGQAQAVLLVMERDSETTFAAAVVRDVVGDAEGLDRCTVAEMDGQALEVPDASFDLAVSMFGLIFFLIVAAFGAAFLDVNPAYAGTPNIVFSSPAWMDSVLKAPLALAVLGVAMLGFTVLAWAKRLWNGSARLHYTLLTVFAGAIVWAMAYWKLWMM